MTRRGQLTLTEPGQASCVKTKDPYRRSHSHFSVRNSAMRFNGASKPRRYATTRSRGSDRENRDAIRSCTSSRPAAQPATSATPI